MRGKLFKKEFPPHPFQKLSQQFLLCESFIFLSDFDILADNRQVPHPNGSAEKLDMMKGFREDPLKEPSLNPLYCFFQTSIPAPARIAHINGTPTPIIKAAKAAFNAFFALNGFFCFMVAQ